MDVLALYDIHGNVDALDAVLADPRAAHPDVVLVGGDAVPGPFARDTLARLDGLSAPARWLWIADGEPELRRTPYDAARAGARMLEAGWPDERSVGGALVDPVEPIVVTRIFEALARG